MAEGDGSGHERVHARVASQPLCDPLWLCQFFLTLSVGQRVNALDGMGDLFLGRSFLLQVFLFSTIFYLVVERGLLFHLFGLVASFFSALVLLHFHLVYDI